MPLSTASCGGGGGGGWKEGTLFLDLALPWEVGVMRERAWIKGYDGRQGIDQGL